MRSIFFAEGSCEWNNDRINNSSSKVGRKKTLKVSRIEILLFLLSLHLRSRLNSPIEIDIIRHFLGDTRNKTSGYTFSIFHDRMEIAYSLRVQFDNDRTIKLQSRVTFSSPKRSN